MRLYERIAEGLISACLKHVVAATRPSPFKVGDNQRPERTMSGVRKPPPESSGPGENLDRGSRRNQLRRGHGSPPVLSEVFSSLAFRCALQRVQTVPAAIHSGRIPPPRPTSHGGGRLISPTIPSAGRTGGVLTCLTKSPKYFTRPLDKCWKRVYYKNRNNS